MNTKQIIVIRKDLNMRKGKLAAQSCHASMAFLTKRMRLDSEIIDDDGESPWCSKAFFFSTDFVSDIYVDEISHWLRNSFRKICVYVESEEELVAVYQKALDAGLIVHMVEDNGATEFNGVTTKTCIAIGPHWDNKFEGVTDRLPLL
jgi:PTH2 family peptidyl-tRNA hydrolase